MIAIQREHLERARGAGAQMDLHSSASIAQGQHLHELDMLDRCCLAFYRDGDIGDDKTWDCWRLEGPSFVWYFRGSPHVHVWANVAADSSVKTNA